MHGPPKVNRASHKRLLDELYTRENFFIEAYLSQIRNIPAYNSKTVSSNELEQTARRIFKILVAELEMRVLESATDQEIDSQKAHLASQLGADRDNQGVPIDALLQAIRLDYLLVWEELQAVCLPGEESALLDFAAPLWDSVDSFASSAYTSYLNASEQKATKEYIVRQEYAARLFDHPVGKDELQRIVRVLKIHENEPLILCAVHESMTDALHQLVHSSSYSAGPCYFVTSGINLLLFFPLRYSSLVESVKAFPCALAVVPHGAGELRDYQSTVTQLANLIRAEDTQALDVNNAWTRVANAACQGIGINISSHIERSLSVLKPTEIERIKLSVNGYLASGSITQVAQETYCHRNTVQNHLNKFYALTGLNPTVPRDAAKIVVSWG